MKAKRPGGGAWVARLMTSALLCGAVALARAAAVEREARPEAATHLVLVVDTSAAMREAGVGRLVPAVFQTVVELLAAQPELRAVQMFDADGRRMLGASDEWLGCGFDLLLGIERVLRRYTESTRANPLPGIGEALARLPWPPEQDARREICVIGEGLVSRGESLLCRLDELNPADARGQRRAVISAVQVAAPRVSRGTRAKVGAGASGVEGESAERGAEANFRALMSEVARQHGGTFRAVGGGGL